MHWIPKLLLTTMVVGGTAVGGFAAFKAACPNGNCAPSSDTSNSVNDPNAGTTNPPPQAATVSVPGMGSVPQGTYTMFYNVYSSPINIPGVASVRGINTGWVKGDDVALSGTALAANLDWIRRAVASYSSQCKESMTEMGVSSSCTGSAIPWDGGRFGIILDGRVKDSHGNFYESKIQLVFGVPGYTP